MADSRVPSHIAHGPTDSIPKTQKRPRSESPEARDGNENNGGASTSTTSRAKRRREDSNVSTPLAHDAATADDLSDTTISSSGTPAAGTKRRRDEDEERIHESSALDLGDGVAQATSSSATSNASGIVEPSGTSALSVSTTTTAGVKRGRDDSVHEPSSIGLGIDNAQAISGDGPQPEDQQEEVQARKRVRLEPNVNSTASNSNAQPPNTQEHALPAPPPQQSEPEPRTEPLQSPILTVPPEIFAEILVNTTSLFSVLSVSRTCKAFRSMLLEPSSKWIWKRVRDSATVQRNNRGCPVVPDFTWEKYRCKGAASDGNNGEESGDVDESERGLLFPTEEAYAKFAYGGYLECEICGEATERPYASYAIRARLCPKIECRKAFANFQAMFPDLYENIGLYPRMERNLREAEKLWPQQTYREALRRSEPAVEAFLAENRDKPDFAERLARKVERNKKWMALCEDLIFWRSKVNAFFFHIKVVNKKLSKAIASKHGWDYDDLLNCTDFGHYCQKKCHNMEPISEIDVAVLLPKINDQLARIAQKRLRRNHDNVYHTFRDQITAHHKYLAKTNTFPVLPSLSAFRDLPVMAMIQKTELELSVQEMKKGLKGFEGKGIKESLRWNLVLNSMVKDQIRRWVQNAKQELGKKLQMKDGGEKGVHPVEHISARFRCTKCTTFPDRYAEDECFDFKGACEHDCSGLSGAKKKKKKKKKKWDAADFERDDKAIAVIDKCIKLLNPQGDLGPHADTFIFGAPVDKGAPTSAGAAAPVNIVCTSCDPPIAVSTKSMIGHSHRHEDMQIALYDTIPWIQFLQFPPVAPGYTRRLLPGTSKEPKEIIQTKVFSCRHCYTAILNKAAAASALKEEKVRNNRAADADAGADVEAAPAVGGAAVASAAVLTVENNRHLNPPGLTFNVLRSHLKAVHKVANIRDEDYFLKNTTI